MLQISFHNCVQKTEGGREPTTSGNLEIMEDGKKSRDFCFHSNFSRDRDKNEAAEKVASKLLAIGLGMRS